MDVRSPKVENKKFKEVIMLKQLGKFKLVTIAITLAIIAIIAFGTLTYTRFGYTDSFGATLTVLNDEIKVYADQDCTIPFDSSSGIQYGQLWPNQNSEPAKFYLKNTTTVEGSTIFPQISVEAPEGLILTEKTFGVISHVPQWTDLFRDAKTTYTDLGISDCQIGYENMSSTQNWFYVSINTMPSSGFIKVNEEIMKFNSIDVSDRWKITNVERGLYGTTPAEHLRLATVTFIKDIVYTPQVALQTGQVQEVELTVKVDDTVESGELDFNIVVQATSTH